MTERFHPDCPLCQIIDNPGPSLVHEDEHIIAIIDKHRKGFKERYLIVTKFGHYSQDELPQEEWDYMIEAARALGKARVWGTGEKYEVDEEQGDFSHASIKVGFRSK